MSFQSGHLLLVSLACLLSLETSTHKHAQKNVLKNVKLNNSYSYILDYVSLDKNRRIQN